MSDQQDSAPAQGSSSGQAVNVQQLKSQIANKFQANKALVLKLHSVLTWEQDVHPIMVVAFVSISFLIIHLMNSSVLTTLSYLGIAAALVDMAMPMIAKSLFGTSAASSKFTEKDNQRFDKICLDLAKVYAFFRNSCNTCCTLKSSKPKVYYPGLLVSLLVLAYIGNKINNLFLTYLVTLFVALYPGLEKKGIPQKLYHKVCGRSASMAASGAGDRRASGKKN